MTKDEEIVEMAAVIRAAWTGDSIESSRQELAVNVVAQKDWLPVAKAAMARAMKLIASSTAEYP